MIIFYVTKDKVSIKQDDTLNRGEYNVTKCKFLFSKEYDGLVKEAIFFIEEKNIGILLDENDECNIPQEAFEFRGNIEIGLYAYYTNNDKLEKRYSPSRTTKVISDGSYTSEIDNTEEITPTDKEQMNSIIKNNVEEIKRLSTNKVDKKYGYNLSENDFSNIYKKKLDGIEQNAQVNKIEKIFINDEEMPNVEKNINITIPTKLTDLKNDNHFVNDKNYVHTDNNFTHAEKEKLKELNNYDDSSLNEKIVENSNSILENKKDIQNLKETSEKNTSNINEFNKNLQNCSLITETGYKLDLSIDNSTYVMTLKLLDKNENVLSTGKIDLPIESMIINVSYDSNVKRLTFSLQNGNIINVPLNDLISGLVTDESLENTLKNYSLIKDVPTKVSQLENDSKYVKNTDYAENNGKAGILKIYSHNYVNIDENGLLIALVGQYNNYTVMSNNAFISKGTLENVITGKNLENANNKITFVGTSSTDIEYPSAKCVYKIKEDVDNLKSDILEKGETSDTFIHVEDSAMAEYQELSVDGVLKQTTTTGKNLLDYVSNLIATEGLTSVINEDGSITTTGKPTNNYSRVIRNIDITSMLEDEQTYTISQSTANNKIYVQIIIDKYDGTYAYHNSIQGSSSFTVNKTIYKKYIITIQSNTISSWGDSPLTITNKYMLCKGIDTADTSFEPYTGGQPSPNPDYPQEIKTIENSLKITSCNKNLFKMNDNYSKGYTTTKNGITLKVEDDLSISLKGTATAKTEFFLFGSWNIKNNRYIPKGIFTISQNGFVDGITSNLGFFKDGVNVQNFGLTYIKTSSLFNSSLIEFDGMSYSISIANGKTIDTQVYTQIENDKKATSYIQHIQSQITANLPEGEFIGKINDTYKDTLKVEYNEEDGQYHLVLNKMVAKVVLDGANNELYGNVSTDYYWEYFRTKFKGGVSTEQSAIVNYLNQTTNARVVIIENGTLYLRFPKSSGIDVSTNKKFNEWAKDHNVIIYYALATPYAVDLGVVDMPITYNEVTNLFTDSDLLPKINVKYYKNFISTIRNLKVNNANLKNELMSINNRLVALESANASTISDEEESEVVNNE